MIIPHSITKSLILLTFFSIFLTSCSKDADFYLIDDTPVSFSDYPEQFIVINYWAEWCKPCLEEVPELNEFYEQYQEQYPLFAVSYDNQSNQVLSEQKHKYQMHYPIIASAPVPRLGIENLSMLPANFIRAPSGKLYGPLLGPQTKQSLLKAIAHAKQQEQAAGSAN